TRAKVREMKELQKRILGVLGLDAKPPHPQPLAPEAGARGAAPATGAMAGARGFADFCRGGFRNWYRSGGAVGGAPSPPRAGMLQADPRRSVKALVAPGQAHSGLVAGKLQGVLRSRTFTLDQKKIHFRVAGRQGLINVVIDGYHLIRDPIYGSLAMKIDHGESLQWRTLDVSMWLGHRAYVEVVDDGPGYVAVE